MENVILTDRHENYRRVTDDYRRVTSESPRKFFWEHLQKAIFRKDMVFQMLL